MRVFNGKTLAITMFLILALQACGGKSPTAAPTQALPQPAPSNPPPPVAAAPTLDPNAPVSLPAEHADQASDPDSSATAAKKLVVAGEKFASDLLERPFNANTMDVYFPYVDIIDTQSFKDAQWGYATITLSGTDANGRLPAKYGVELDLNRDGRGDWLILATNPTWTVFSTQGVQVFKDADGDVGGKFPIAADKPAGGNGYESLVFDQGQGDDPGSAFVRVAPEDPKTVEFAFKLSVIGNPKSFMEGAWAGTDSLSPALFDLNDHFTHEQAGSPLPELVTYPLKDVYEIDNTCRMAIGFAPNGNEPGLCPLETDQKVKKCKNKCQYGSPDPETCQCPPG